MIDAMRGEYGRPIRIIWYERGRDVPEGELANALSVTGIMEPLPRGTGSAKAVAGSLYIADAELGYLTWILGQTDVDTAGDFALYFTCALQGGGNIIALPSYFTIYDVPTVT